MNLGILDHANIILYEKSIFPLTSYFIYIGKRPTKRLCLDHEQLYKKGIHVTHARWREAIHFGLYAEG